MNEDATRKASIAPATGIPVVPVRLSKEDCGDGREIVLRIDAKAELTLNGKNINRDDLESRLDEQLRTRSDKVVFVGAEGSLSFHLVADVPGRVRSNGRVALIPQVSGDGSFECLIVPAARVCMPGAVALPRPSLKYVAPWTR
jgi:hypothetical protein